MISWRLGSAYAALAIVVFALIAGSVHLAFSYVQTRMMAIGELQTETRHVAPEGARHVEAEIIIGSGQLNLTGGASELLEAEFRYYTPPLYSTMAYTVTNEAGELILAHASPDVVPRFERAPEFQSRSEVKLNNSIPLSLTLGLGVHEAHLRFAGLNLSYLEVAMALGKGEIDLRHDWQHSFDVLIEGGFGEALVRLPAETGVQVRIEEEEHNVTMQGLRQDGDFYVNDTFGKTPVTLVVTVADEGKVHLAVEP